MAELHKNIRPFVCEICHKTYGRKDYLDRHLKSHEDSKGIVTDIQENETGDTMTTTVVVETGASDVEDEEDVDDVAAIVDASDPITEDDEVLPSVVTVVSNNQD